MWTFVVTIFTVYNYLMHPSDAIRLIDLPRSAEQSKYRSISQVKQDLSDSNYEEDISEDNAVKKHVPKYPPIRSTKSHDNRRWFVTDKPYFRKQAGFRPHNKDDDLKQKIATLVQQTLHDTERKMKSIQTMKDKNRDQPPYRAGFILSMVKKTRDIMNELFNVAVKHREEWKALEQLKIFELIVHTNVDTTNLVRQLVEIHIQYLNSTSNDDPHHKKVVLL